MKGVRFLDIDNPKDVVMVRNALRSELAKYVREHAEKMVKKYGALKPIDGEIPSFIEAATQGGVVRAQTLDPSGQIGHPADAIPSMTKEISDRDAFPMMLVYGLEMWITVKDHKTDIRPSLDPDREEKFAVMGTTCMRDSACFLLDIIRDGNKVKLQRGSEIMLSWDDGVNVDSRIGHEFFDDYFKYYRLEVGDDSIKQ